ncbi:MAG: HAD hydrolase-like protein [Prevotella sp.]|nr:HAD hydrolase-like protein [Prevotella sp.]
MKKPIKFIAFDADDTLWDCQGHFERVMQELYTLLEPWTDRQKAAEELFATERKNMPLLGYGTKAFSLSMIETALRVSHHEMAGDKLAWLQDECYSLLNLPATPLPEVDETLRELQRRGWHMAVFTKGELLDQEHKLQRSRLSRYFEYVEITSDKTEREFQALCRHLGIKPEELLMVGNSMKSDIAPALAIGAQAVHIPFHITWELEHAETVDHEGLTCITHFSELLHVVG